MIKILILEDILSDLELVLFELKKSNLNFDFLHVDTGKKFRKGLVEYKPDLILSDYLLPNYTGMSALLLSKELCPLTPVIIVTGSMNEEVAVECMKAGASDYLIKEHLTRLPFAIKEVLKEKKHSLEKIKSDERLKGLSQIVENSTNEIYLFDISTQKFIYANKEALNNLGFSKESLLLLSPIDIIYDFSRDSFFSKAKSLLDGEEEAINFETILKRKDGSTYNVEVSVQLADFENKKSFVAIARDITKRKNAEKVLKDANEFNQSLINTIPFGLDIVDMEGNILFMNDLLKDTIGIEEPKGKCWEYYKDNEEQCKECPLRHELILGETNICEVHNVLGGKEFEVTHTTMNYKGEKAILEIFRDITEEKIAERKIIQLSRGIEQSPEMVIITDIDGNIKYANPRVTEITGFLPEELIGKNARILQSGNTPKQVYEDLWETIKSGNIWKGELLNKRKSGEVYWEAASISPIIDKIGKTINYIAIKDDITEKIIAMTELIEAKEKAVQSDKMKREFLAQMSHEIRTPLNIIANFAFLLKDEFCPSDNEDLQELFQSIDSASKRIIRTVDLILNVSEIQSGSFVPILTDVDLKLQVLNKIIEEYNDIADRNDVKLFYNAQIENSVLNCDEYCVKQIFTNIIDNAIKYSPKGKVTVSLFNNKQNKLAFEVVDTGIGISKEFLENLFIPFVQEEQGYTRKYDGNGLGLVLVKHYCDMNNASLEVESEKNVGSTFRVIFN